MSGKRKVKLAPCAPYELDAMEDWLNEEAASGWQIRFLIPVLNCLVVFERGEGGPYSIVLERPDFEKGHTCTMRHLGFVVERREERREGDEGRARARYGWGIILANLLDVAVILSFATGYESLRSATNASIMDVTPITLIIMLACFAVMVFSVIYIAARRPVTADKPWVCMAEQIAELVVFVCVIITLIALLTARPG